MHEGWSGKLEHDNGCSVPVSLMLILEPLVMVSKSLKKVTSCSAAGTALELGARGSKQASLSTRGCMEMQHYSHLSCNDCLPLSPGSSEPALIFTNRTVCLERRAKTRRCRKQAQPSKTIFSLMMAQAESLQRTQQQKRRFGDTE